MNKKIKKLELHRETLRNLNERDVKEAVGGATVRTCESVTCNASCDCSVPPTFFCC